VQQIPRFLRVSLYALLLIAGALSVPAIGRYGPIPTTTLLDGWFMLFIVTCFVRGKTSQRALLGVLIAYALTRVVPALYTEAPILDFLQAYRWVFYLLAMAYAVGRTWGPIGPLIKVMWLLLGMATTKAALTFLIAREGTRPGLLLENNFELALFSGLVAVLYRHLGRWKFGAVALLGALTVLSGSRSGALAFVVLAVFAVTQIPQTRANLFQRFLLLVAVPLLTLIPVYTFASRTETVRIDRLNFLDVFFYETHDWNVFNWLFGTVPITPLTDGCKSLAFYADLFATTNDGTCYSVILHAFLMRVIFDAGIFGAVLAFGVLWFTMRKAGTTRLLALCLLAIALVNSASVSGPNNPYVALPVLLAILTAGITPAPAVEAARAKRGPRRRYTRQVTRARL
jgi:hypothetical protein